MRPKTLLYRLGGLAVVTMAALGIPLSGCAPSAGAAPATPSSCAWPVEATAATLDIAALNRGTPDSGAAYWIMPFTVQNGLRIVVSGRYPDSRYASFEVYKPGGGMFRTNGVSSVLTDYRIKPNPGSVNPWQRPVSARGKFTVTLRADVAPGEANTLPLAPAGITTGTGLLIYRIYLPAAGNASHVRLPALTLERSGVSKQLPLCAAKNVNLPAPSSGTQAKPGAPSPPDSSIQFARPTPESGSGAGTNADTGYLVAEVTPPADGDVVVIRGKAPTAPKGSHPSPWPAPHIDTRYWSMCNNLATSSTPLVVNKLPGGKVDYGCRNDTQTRLDDHGDYTYIVGTEAQRATIDSIPGATFLPFSTSEPTTPHLLLLRDLLPGPSFAHAIQDVPPNENPTSAGTVMGPYYPKATICPLATLARQGIGACPPGTS
jgi:hypothetical protein